jgi:hypothetical protein
MSMSARWHSHRYNFVPMERRDMRVWPLALLAAAGVVAASPVARAETEPTETVRLVWVRGERTESCEDGAAIARRVVARLGKNVFSESSPRSIEGVIQHEGEHWEAHLYVRDSGGILVGSRDLSSEGPDCGAIDAAATLAIVLTIDPDAALRPPQSVPSPAPAPPPRPAMPLAAHSTSGLTGAPAFATPPAPGTRPPITALPDRPAERPRRPPPSSPSSSEAAVISVRALVAGGLLPAVSAGVALSAEVPVQGKLSFSVGLFYFPEVRTPSADSAFGLTAGWLGACARPWQGSRIALSSCLKLLLGAIHSVVFVRDPYQPGDQPWGGASLSAQARVRLFGSLHAELGGEIIAPVARQRFAAQGQAGTIFQEGPVAGAGFAGFAWSIP